MKYATISNIVKGEYGRSNGRFLDVFSPLNGEVISQVPLSSADVVDEAVAGTHRDRLPRGGGFVVWRAESSDSRASGGRVSIAATRSVPRARRRIHYHYLSSEGATLGTPLRRRVS